MSVVFCFVGRVGCNLIHISYAIGANNFVPIEQYSTVLKTEFFALLAIYLLSKRQLNLAHIWLGVHSQGTIIT